MFPIYMFRRKMLSFNKYYLNINFFDKDVHPTGRLNLRSLHCPFPKNASIIIRQLQPNLTSSNQLSITTIQFGNKYQKNNNDISHQLLQCILACDTESAFKHLKTMHITHIPIRSHYFWPLIIQMHNQHGEQGVLDVLDRMIALNVPIDHDTLVHYLCPRLNLSDPLLTIRKLQDRNIKVQQLLTPMCVCLIQDNQIEEVIALCFNHFPLTKLTHEDFVVALVNYYINTNDSMNTVKLIKRADGSDKVADVFLTKISQSKNSELKVEKVQVIITEFLKAGIDFSSSAVYDLKSYFSKHKLSTSDFTFYEKTSHRTPPRLDVDRPVPSLSEMSTTELEYRLISMKSRDLDPTSVLKRLLFKYCQEKQYEKAREVRDELQASGTKFTPGMHSSCIDICIHFHEADEAFEVLSHIQQSNPRFRVDAYKVLNLARVFAQQGQYQKSQNLVSSIRLEQGANLKNLERNCRELLASIQDEDHLISMFNLLRESKICAVNTTPILSTIIRYFLKSNNLDKAVSYFERFSKFYRKTPLIHELLCTCISQHRPELYQQVRQLHSALHGPDSTAVSCITALSDVGEAELLHTYVSKELNVTPQFTTKMISQIQRIADENKTNALILLKEAFRNNESLVDHIYFALLQTYCRKNAEEEIKQLKEDYEKIKKPSDKFCSILNSRLKIKPFTT